MNPHSSIDKIADILSKYSRFLLVIHQFPDGDTIASSLALYIALTKLNKKVDIVCRDKIPSLFRFLPEVKKIKNDFLQGDWDAVIVLDCGDLKRTGFSDRLSAFARRRRRLINIDHHPKNDLHRVANINLFDERAAAVGELVFKIINQIGVEVRKDIATCLLTSIFTDTGGFMHSNTSVRTLKLAAHLLKCGARLKLISRYVAGRRTLATLRLWGVALSHIIYNEKYQIVYSVITQEDLKNCLATTDDIAGAVNLINSIPELKAVLLFAQWDFHRVRVSVRTENPHVNVSHLAEIFSGGGHKKAAGFSLTGKLDLKSAGWKLLS